MVDVLLEERSAWPTMATDKKEANDRQDHFLLLHGNEFGLHVEWNLAECAGFQVRLLAQQLKTMKMTSSPRREWHTVVQFTAVHDEKDSVEMK